MTDLSLHATAESSFADNRPSRVSTGGYVVHFAGGPVAWTSKKQTFVTLNSIVAEYINLTPTAATSRWLGRVLEQLLDQKIRTPAILLTDSANAYANVMNPLDEARTRRIDLR